MHDDVASLPVAEFGFPGPLRDQLVAAITSGTKTSTTSLRVEYEHDGEPLPQVGARSVVVDSDDRAVAVIEVTAVRVATLSDVDWAHARDEGEGFGSVADWRAGHESFWHSKEFREAIGEPEFTVRDVTEVVMERFRVAADLISAL